MKFRFTIGRRIGLGFAILILLTLVAFILTFITLRQSKRTTDQVINVYTPSINDLQELNILMIRSQKLVKHWVSTQNDDEDKKKLKSLLREEYPELKNDIEILSNIKVDDKYIWTEEEKTEIKTIFTLIDQT